MSVTALSTAPVLPARRGAIFDFAVSNRSARSASSFIGG